MNSNIFRRPLPLVVVAIFLSSCANQEIEKLKKENELLKLQLSEQKDLQNIIVQAHSMFDSMDYYRRLESQQPVPNMISRLQELRDYVKLSETKMAVMQVRLDSMREENFAYVMMVDALKTEAGVNDESVQLAKDSMRAIVQGNAVAKKVQE